MSTPSAKVDSGPAAATVLKANPAGKPPVQQGGEAARARSSTHRRPPVLGILVVALAAAGVWAWYTGRLDPNVIRTWLPWRKEGKPRALTLYGNVDVRQVNLAFKVEGRIASLGVDEGDAVEAGAEIGTLDRKYFEDALRLATSRRDAQAATLARLEHGSRPEEIAEARAVVVEREALSARADISFHRIEALVKRNSSTRQELDDAEAAAQVARAQLASAREALRLAEIGPRVEDVDVARAQLAAAEAELTQAERRLEDSRLLAPGQGIILTRAREVGAIVQPGETVFALTLASPVWVRTYLSEPDLGRVYPGMQVEVLTDSAPGRPYRGHIGFVSPTAEFTPKTVETEELRTRLVYRVRIVVDNADSGLRQGMPVTVRLPFSAVGSTP